MSTEHTQISDLQNILCSLYEYKHMVNIFLQYLGGWSCNIL